MGIQRDCMSDRIKKAILDRITNGTYVPGDRLVELQIAKEFNTSQAPIREAFSQLEAMRIIETEPYKGTRVREIPERELKECIEVRAVLEMLAAEQASNWSAESIEDLRSKALDTVAAAKQRDFIAYSKTNLQFHRAVVGASGNETLLRVWDSLALESRMLSTVRANEDRLPECADEHLEIVQAFAEGDNRFAARLLKKHAELVLQHKLAPRETV